MKTTLKELKKIYSLDIIKLKKNLNIDYLDVEVSILEILNSNGIKDAVRALKTQKYKNYCLFLADVAESVLHLFEKEYPNDKRPRKAIEGIRLYHAGKITGKELEDLRREASAAAYHANAAAAYAVRAVAGDAYYIAYNAAYSAANAAYSAANAADAARKEKWYEIEKLFLKHFDNNHLLDESLFVI